jgi:hypothetical protein
MTWPGGATTHVDTVGRTASKTLRAFSSAAKTIAPAVPSSDRATNRIDRDRQSASD